jgi:hypothetical protein
MILDMVPTRKAIWNFWSPGCGLWWLI